MRKDEIVIDVITSQQSIALNLLKEQKLIKQYVFKSKYNLSKISNRLCIVAMLRWAICENLNANFSITNFSLMNAEVTYLKNEIGLLIDLMREKIGDTAKDYTPMLNYSKKKSINLGNCRFIDNTIALGFSNGKDSVCCQLLLKKSGYNIETFQFDFDHANFSHDFHTKYNINDATLAKKYSTQSIFLNNDVSYYQEEDMHIIYLAPILLSAHKGYYTKMACGVQWDMLSQNGKGITIAESFASMKNLINLTKLMGFPNFGIVLPISAISSFGVYRILSDEYGLSKLEDFNLCWISAETPCGSCTKCIRVTFTQDILKACISGDFYTMLNIIEQNQIPVDFLFGSQNICTLLNNLSRENIRDISKDLYIQDIKPEYDAGFSKIIEKEYGFKEAKP